MLSFMSARPSRVFLVVGCLLVTAQAAPPAAGPVKPGIEVFLSDVPARLRGARVGLITNHAGVDRAGTADIDLIAAHKDLKLVALFAAEHGIRGTAAAGEKIDDERDARTGVPIFSLYKTEDRGPTSEMLANVEVLVYDLPEVGGRTWTYVSTMALAMQAAARRRLPFVVLDRPNPIGGEIVEGALLDPAFKSFVGMYPIPARHGMTVGELATFFNREFGIGADLIVARAEGWRRAQWFTDTGLPWRNPSPNLRSPTALNNYPGTVYFEGTNLAEGRGTDRPFELPAVQLLITDREAYRPVRTALLLIDETRRQHPKAFAWGKSIDRLTGSDKVRRAMEGGTLAALLDDWEREAAAFRERRKPFLLYE